MVEVRFPGQQTMTTTVVTRTVVQSNQDVNERYLKTIPGNLKLLQIACGLIGFICVQVARGSNGTFFSCVAVIGMLLSGALLALHVFRVMDTFRQLPWLWIELGYGSLWAFCYLLASILAITASQALHYAAACFGFLATFAYAADAFLLWRGSPGPAASVETPRLPR